MSATLMRTLRSMLPSMPANSSMSSFYSRLGRPTTRSAMAATPSTWPSAWARFMSTVTLPTTASGSFRSTGPISASAMIRSTRRYTWHAPPTSPACWGSSCPTRRGFKRSICERTESEDEPFTRLPSSIGPRPGLPRPVHLITMDLSPGHRITTVITNITIMPPTPLSVARPWRSPQPQPRRRRPPMQLQPARMAVTIPTSQQ
mmetsp:Transcript_6597/g.18427  ORF Transcript_6597/g.18427 Transcript_6597/m.18427 type:complete len:203 (-) Transcript_6597:2210-2818(-)